MSSICQEKPDYSEFETFQGNQKPNINKSLRKAIMKRSQFKNKANKTRNATDVVKLSNRCKKDHFDR